MRPMSCAFSLQISAVQLCKKTRFQFQYIFDI
jgi:hypothetical protein